VAEAPVEIDELFPDDEGPTAEEILEASNAEIEELDAEDDVEIVEADSLPIGRAWAFNFDEQRFVMDGRSPAVIRGEASVLAWVEKCLRTQQGSSVVQPPDFGLVQSITDYIGDDPGAVTSLTSDIEEALTVHPAISAVEDIEVELGETPEGDAAVEVSFIIVLGDGTEIPFDAELEPEAAA